jgi:hypothetical protein
MDGARIYHEDMTEEAYAAISVGDIITVFNQKYAVDKKVGDRFKSIYLREPRVLECSSKGDHHFSALYAVVEVYGKADTIERHYQLSKRFDNPKGDWFNPPNEVKDAKGKTPTCFVVNSYLYPVEFLSMWYKLLWMKYLDNHPLLVDFASQYDDFTDMFRGKARNCQADVIRQYVKEGRKSVYDDCLPLVWAMRENNKKEDVEL